MQQAKQNVNRLRAAFTHLEKYKYLSFYLFSIGKFYKYIIFNEIYTI